MQRQIQDQWQNAFLHKSTEGGMGDWFLCFIYCLDFCVCQVQL